MGVENGERFGRSHQVVERNQNVDERTFGLDRWEREERSHANQEERDEAREGSRNGIELTKS